MRVNSDIMNFYWSHAIALQKLSNERSYKFSWILTLAEVISIRILRMRVISAIMNFYWFHSIALQKLSTERSCKFSWILTLTEVISIRILRMRVISDIMNFYWSHAIALQKLSNERSYKFSWILTLTEVISIRNLRFFAIASNNDVHLTQRTQRSLNGISKNYSLRRRQKLRSNTHDCELIILALLIKRFLRYYGRCSKKTALKNQHLRQK